MPAGLDPRLWEVVRSMNLPEEIWNELHEFPDLAGDTLLDTVEHLGFVDRPDLAEDLLEAIRAHPPTREIGQYATYTLTERYRSQGRTREADVLVEQLLDSGPEPGPAHLLAEELEEKGRLEEALRCYNVSAREDLALSATDLTDVDHYGQLMSLMGRARVRELLGIPLDEHDRAVRSITQKIAERFEDGELVDSDDGLFGWPEELHAAPHKPRRVEVAFSRSTLARARDLGMISPETTEADHYRDTEHTLRTTAREQPETELFVMVTDADQVADFAEREGLDPAARDTIEAWAKVADTNGSSHIVSWPPERNKPCWCGSGHKYKKCCRPRSAR